MAKEYFYNKRGKKIHLRDVCGATYDSPHVECFETFREAVNNSPEGTEWCDTCFERIYELKGKYTRYKVCKTCGLWLFLISSILLIVFLIFSAVESSDGESLYLAIPFLLIWLTSLPYLLYVKSIKKKYYKDFVKYQDYLGADFKNTFKKGAKPIIIFLILGLIFIAISSISKSCSDNNEAKEKYKETFNKDPNTWTEEEEYVNDLFDWIDKNDNDK